MRQALTIFAVTALFATASWAQETDPIQPRDPAGSAAVLPFKLDANSTYDFRAVCEKPGTANDPSRRGDSRILYRLTSLRDAAGGGANISIMIDAEASAGKPATDSTDPAKDAGKDQPDDKSRAEDLLGRDRHERKVVTVQVDQSGRILSVKGMEEFRAHVRTAGSTLDQEAIDAVESHIALILGCGLHGRSLEPGQVYSVAGVPRSGSTQPSGSVPPPKATEGVAADRSRAVGALPQLRFEGVSGDRANFVIVDPAAPKPVTGDEASKGTASDDAAKRAAKSLGMGTASYSTKDGLLQSLNGRMDSATAGAPKADTAPVARFSIVRIDGDARIEPPR